MIPERDRPALIALGSNLGDRDAALDRAAALLDDADGVAVLARSRVRTTAPVGRPPQPDFRNACLLVRTRLGPRELLRLLHAVESSLGRERGGARWGPRTVDLDLVLHGELRLGEDDIVVPHPRMHERRFVLEPAADVAPGMRDPRDGRTVAQLLAALESAPDSGEDAS